VAGAGEVIVDYKKSEFRVGDTVIKKGEEITLNGTIGEVIVGQVEMCEPEVSGYFETIMLWSDDVREMRVRTNADTPEDCQVARDFGAEGIGLCRTEHMFFAEDRIAIMREVILAKDDETRRAKAVEKLRPVQKEDFVGIFKVMNGFPVTIRLLDPPLHEFLPSLDAHEKIAALSKEMGLSVDDLKKIIGNLHEINPMLGHRGCRLGITCPELYAMQVRAIMQAAFECHEQGITVIPEIEVPLIGEFEEFKAVHKIAMDVISKLGEIPFEYKIGTMIEIPRACLTAHKIAEKADFLSFGTNDLTQLTYGYSRDDAGSFLAHYIEAGILTDDPTETIDQIGVGSLMQTCVNLGRETKPDLEIGICGEHGGEPRSVEFCHTIGLDYVSCSPYRVPIARLAAAQAVLKEKAGELAPRKARSLKKTENEPATVY